MNTEEQSGAKKEQSTHALFFELEYVGTDKRRVEFETIQAAVKTKGLELSSVLFSRSEMSPLPRAAISSILRQAGKRADAIEKAVAMTEKGIAAFCEKTAELKPGVQALIDAAKKRGIPVVAFTALSENDAKNLMARLGLDKAGVELLIPDEVKDSFPRADAWLKMLKKCDRESTTLVAVVSSQTACKGALTAGAACIAVPDPFTAFQDFSGAKVVLDSLDEENPDELLDLTLRM